MDNVIQIQLKDKKEEVEPLVISRQLLEYALLELSTTLYQLDEKKAFDCPNTVNAKRFSRLKRLTDSIDSYLLDNWFHFLKGFPLFPACVPSLLLSWVVGLGAPTDTTATGWNHRQQTGGMFKKKQVSKSLVDSSRFFLYNLNILKSKFLE